MKVGPNINRGMKGDPYRNLAADICNLGLDDLLSQDEYTDLSKEDVSTMGLTVYQLEERRERCRHHRSALRSLRCKKGDMIICLRSLFISLDYDIDVVGAAIKEKYGWNVMKNT